MKKQEWISWASKTIRSTCRFPGSPGGQPAWDRLLVSVVFLATMLGGRVVVSAQPANNPQNWERFKIRKDGFSILLPAVPTVISRGRYNNDAPGKDAWIYAAYEDGVVYFVISFDNPDHRSLDYFLEKQLRLAELRDSEVAARTEAVNGSLKGAQYTFTRYDFRRTFSYPGVVQLYDIKNRVVALVATGKDEHDPSVRRFLESADLGDKPAGRDIGQGVPNGEGPQPAADLPTVPSNEVSRKVMILTKPEPRYSEEARRKQLRGNVILRAVLSSSGKVVDIKGVSGLPLLVASGIEAARKMYFIPAMKNGRFVSTSVELQYNFNLF